MFTGIVQAMTAIKGATDADGSLVLTLKTPKGWRIKPGDSLATNGACLTVEKKTAKEYQCRLMPETLAKTTFGIQVPAVVNLERSLVVGQTMDGHFVTGHIDCVGTILSTVTSGDARIFEIRFPTAYRRFCVPKGSLCVDGVSLTVVSAGRDRCTVSLVAYTLEKTVLGSKSAGDVVNLEFDILAKYAQAA